ncbi:MAG: UDP-N-acetylglucosamine 1-carboxyvinyltransferase [Chloroflexota bacterium]|nr:UDP-N-acetylglucosamine 1-carboxyvinyltransferase [Chloroflexota bacterium]
MSAVTEPYFKIDGLRRLNGVLRVNGAKNAALPCLAASLLSDEPSRLRWVPDIEDVHRFLEILSVLGVESEFEDNEVVVRPSGVCEGSPPDALAAALRASFLVMGPLLVRTGMASCGTPGGDVIGARPLDVHLAGFRALGAEVESVGGRTIARAPTGLRGATFVLDYPSVLGTENLLLAATLAKGRTRLVNAAMEPEIVCLADALNQMGARISGAGDHTITIDGVERLSGADHELIPDRIESGSLLIAAAATRGQVCLQGVRPDHLEALLGKLGETGVEVRRAPAQLDIGVGANARLLATNLQSLPYPGFATDLQAPMTALLTQVEGTSVVHERVFENRMQHLGELRKFGANIIAGGAAPVVIGPTPLSGAVVRGTDIRATAALIVAALAAEGESRIYGVNHLSRGYADLAGQLRGLGADIELVGSADTLAN